MTDAKTRLLQMIADEPHMGGGGLLKAVTKAQKMSKAAKTAAKVIEAPSVIIPGKLSDLKEVVRGKMGNYGAKRVERAADEIPNLERMYREEALRQAFTGDNAKGLMTLNPADFEKYATPLMTRDRPLPNSGVKKENLPTDEYVNYLAGLNEYHDVPFLEINKQEYGLPLVPFISGHEGRHRNRAMAQRGEQTGLVQLLPRSELREPFSRRTQEEYLQALRDEMEMTGNRVKPQAYFDNFEQKDIKRPAIELPDIYAEGGDVHMAGGGRTPKYPWERYPQPKKVPEMRARQITPVAGAIKSGADYATQLIDKGPSFADLMGNVVGAVPFVGPDLRKRMEASNISIPTDINLASNMPAEDYEYGQPMQYRKPGISTTSVPTKDVLEALNISDFVGTPGLSKVAEDIGYGQTPDPLDLLDAASAAALGYGAIKGGLKGGRKAAGALSDLAKSEAGYKLAQKVIDSPYMAPMSMNIVKEPGGNWLGGETEKQLKKLQMGSTVPKQEMDELKSSIDKAKQTIGREANGDGTIDRAIRQMENELDTQARNNAMNAWVESNLTNYVKKQMGTKDDPVRKLAEQGILHMEPFGNADAGRLTMRKRAGLGYPYQGVGESDKAKFWERLADAAIDPYPAGSYKHGTFDESILLNNPWLKNVPDETMINSAKGLTRDLGFDHITDVLREDLAAGRIRPEQLNKVSMEQAVRRAHEFDQEMAKKMRETQAKVTEGMPVHKEYPEGYKWVELQKSDKLPEGWTVDKEGNAINPEGYYAQHPGEKQLEEALKYEGDTMGHCVGGYCPDVLEGRSRIFSLRDAKGEPHVTVEVQPSKTLTSEKRAAQIESLMHRMRGEGMSEEAAMRQAEKLYPESETMPRIVQIKGKQNRAPKEDYLPFVQDFVKGGQWSDVGDLQNTGLRPTKDAFNETEQAFLKSKGVELKPYIDPEETARYQELFKQNPPEPGMAEGGEVKSFFEEKSAKQRLLDMLAKEPHMAGGGLLKAIGKAQKAAKATEKAAEVAAKTAQVVPTPAAPVLIPGLMQKSTAAQIGREERVRRQAAAAAEAARVQAAKQTPVPVGYVPHTPKSLNPHVGFRFEADEPVGITPSPTLDVGALERSYKGASMLPLPWDITNRNVRVSGVSGEKLAHDIWTHGGIPYSADEEHLLTNIGGASGRGIAERIQNREAIARAENKQAGGTGEILHAVNTMGAGSENYALPSSEFAVDVIGRRFMNGQITLKQAEELTDTVRNWVNPITKRQPFKNWAGFLSRDGVQQIYTGEGLKGPAGDLRKVIAENILYKKKNQELLDFNTEDFVNAITHAPLRGVGRGYIGGNLLSNAESSPMRLSKTADYPWLNPYDTNFSAKHIGQLEDLVPIQAVMSRKIAPIEQELLAKQAAKKDGKPYTDASLQGSAISALEKRKDNVSQVMDSRFFQDLADYYDALKTPLEKKKGGLAHSKKVKRHGNTVPH